MKSEEEVEIDPIHSYGLIEDFERMENSYSDGACPQEWADNSCRADEEPHQLWSSLGADSLEDSSITDPILSALYETWRMDKESKLRESWEKENNG